MTPSPTPSHDLAAHWRDRLSRFRNDGSCEREILDALCTPSPPPVEEVVGAWRSIESAPKDGTLILTYSPGAKAQGFETVRTNYFKGGEWQRTNARYWPATHWQPLPPPPGLQPLPEAKSGAEGDEAELLSRWRNRTCENWTFGDLIIAHDRLQAIVQRQAEELAAHRASAPGSVPAGWKPIGELLETENPIIIWDEETEAPEVWAATTYFEAMRSTQPYMAHLKEKAITTRWWMPAPASPWPHPAEDAAPTPSRAPQPGVTVEQIVDRIKVRSTWQLVNDGRMEVWRNIDIMHRRAQKAEGKLSRAQSEIEHWKSMWEWQVRHSHYLRDRLRAATDELRARPLPVNPIERIIELGKRFS